MDILWGHSALSKHKAVIILEFPIKEQITALSVSPAGKLRAAEALGSPFHVPIAFFLNSFTRLVRCVPLYAKNEQKGSHWQFSWHEQKVTRDFISLPLKDFLVSSRKRFEIAMFFSTRKVFKWCLCCRRKWQGEASTFTPSISGIPLFPIKLLCLNGPFQP